MNSTSQPKEPKPMSSFTLVLRSLTFFWRAHLGVVLGVAVGSAALIGALVVGDSVRGSLREMALQRLGWVQIAMPPTDRFFTERFAERLQYGSYTTNWVLPQEVGLGGSTQRFLGATNKELNGYAGINAPVVGALMLAGTAARQDGIARANQVSVLGVTWDFWLSGKRPAWFPKDLRPGQLPRPSEWSDKIKERFSQWIPLHTIVLNEVLASQLQAKVGDDIVLRMPKPGGFSREVPIATQNDATVAMRVKVHAIAKASEIGNFSLQASQLSPMNAFVRLDDLQQTLALKDKANLLLIGQIFADVGSEQLSVWTRIMRKVRGWFGGQQIDGINKFSWIPIFIPLQTEQALEVIRKTITFGFFHVEDSEAELHQLTNNMVELRTSRIFLDRPITQAAQDLYSRPKRRQPDIVAAVKPQPILTYLGNLFRAGTNTTPYSMITAADEPWTPEGMQDDEIIVNQWLADDLQVKVGDQIQLSYFLPESAGNLVEATNSFRVRAVVPMSGVYDDRTLMPKFPGLSKAESTHDWDAGFPLVHKIRDKDEDYWKKFRGTPKAFVTLRAGQKLWGNRFGNLTAIRWSFPSPAEAIQAKEAISKSLSLSLNPEALGLQFVPVREQALKAANQAQDFGQLFLGFSFFLIAAALILMALLFQFGLERRTAEVGTFLALGFTPKQVRRIFLGEALGLSIVGAVIGVVGGIGYAWGMLQGLGTIWKAAVQTSALSYHASFMTLCIGFFASVLVSILSIWLVLRKQGKKPARILLSEGVDGFEGPFQAKKSILRLKSIRLGVGAGMAAIALTCWALAKGDTGAAGLFFGSGALLLIAGLSLMAALLVVVGWRGSKDDLSIGSLGFRACTRRRKRSLATAALLACGSFLIVAVGANRLDANRDAQKRSSGTGGFALLGNSSLPVVYDLNTERGRDFYSLDANFLRGVEVVPFRVRNGDDASCLNLNRAQKPRILGVNPELLAKRGAFTFVKVAKGYSLAEGWGNLANSFAGTVRTNGMQIAEVPAVGDENSILWAMGKKVGDTIDYTDERGNVMRLRLVGAVANSILQGNLLISEQNFRDHFPGESGYRMFLVDAPAERADELSAEMSRGMQNVGFELVPTAQRLAAFNAVQNTYLNTFQVLGGLGLLLGSAGLGIVLLRNVLERRRELALLQAVGFRRRTLRWLVLSEHVVLLALGLGLGILSAIIAVLPVMIAPGSERHFVALVITLFGVFIIGLASTWGATRMAMHGELLSALRNE